MVSYHGFELHGAIQCNGSSSDLCNSQGVCLMCVIVVDGVVDDALDMVGECCSDGDREFRIGECCLASRLLCVQEVGVMDHITAVFMSSLVMGLDSELARCFWRA